MAGTRTWPAPPRQRRTCPGRPGAGTHRMGLQTHTWGSLLLVIPRGGRAAGGVPHPRPGVRAPLSAPFFEESLCPCVGGSLLTTLLQEGGRQGDSASLGSKAKQVSGGPSGEQDVRAGEGRKEGRRDDRDFQLTTATQPAQRRPRSFQTRQAHGHPGWGTVSPRAEPLNTK